MHAALVRAMSEFGDDFDLTAIAAAYGSDDPDEINKVGALESDFVHVVNFLLQIAELGYHELLRLGKVEKTAGPPFKRLRELGAISAQRCSDLEELAVLRNRLQHVYPDIAPQEIHRAIRALLDVLPGTIKDYRRWLEQLDD